MSEDTELIQGSDLWLYARCGSIGASRIADILAKTKTGESASVRNYRTELVCERLSGIPTKGYVNAAMTRGTELEPVARDCYSFLKGVDVEQVGIIRHPTILNSHCSPDGVLPDGLGLVEIKVPSPATHVDYMLAGKVPAQYVSQLVWQMACTGRQYVDFVSYCDQLPEEMQLFVVRLDRDDAKIAEIEEAVRAFDVSVEEQIAALKEACK